jgi:hypothetical protein
MEHYGEQNCRPPVSGNADKFDPGRIWIVEFDGENGEIVFRSEAREHAQMAAPHGTVRLDKVVEDGDLGFALWGISSQ